MTPNQRISLKKLLVHLDKRIEQYEEARRNLVLSINNSFSRGPIEYPPGGKKRVRQHIREKITEFEGSIKELQLLKEYLAT